MYCPNCGSLVKSELHYCNTCGMRLKKEEKESDGSIAETLSTAIGFIGTFGLIGFIFLIRTLLGKNVDEGLIVAVSFLYLATVFGICTMLLKQISNSKTAASNHDLQSDYAAPQIKSVNTNRLEESKQNPASVVEETTRTLDEMPLERK